MLAQSVLHDLPSFDFESLSFFRFEIDNSSLEILLKLFCPIFLKFFMSVLANYLNSLHIPQSLAT